MLFSSSSIFHGWRNGCQLNLRTTRKISMFFYPSLPAMEVPLSKTPHLYGAEFFLTVLPCIIIPLFSYSCVFLFALCQSLVPYVFPYSFYLFFYSSGLCVFMFLILVNKGSFCFLPRQALHLAVRSSLCRPSI